MCGTHRRNVGPAYVNNCAANIFERYLHVDYVYLCLSLPNFNFKISNRRHELQFEQNGFHSRCTVLDHGYFITRLRLLCRPLSDQRLFDDHPSAKVFQLFGFHFASGLSPNSSICTTSNLECDLHSFIGRIWWDGFMWILVSSEIRPLLR